MYFIRLNIHPSETNMTKIGEGCSSIAWINDLKFHQTREGVILGAGSHDKKFYVYNIPEYALANMNDSPHGDEWDNWFFFLQKFNISNVTIFVI
jgi:hypothetical protein